ncbi:MAG: RNA polymerase sigma factor, partial [Planctomycetes bacterium]|nr:RNA polymerase sigma factor [Planctomycetota bacterium]
MSSLEHELLRQAGALRGLARALVGRDDAEDLVQETALRAMRAAPPRPGSLAGYLATVLRRLASTHRRGERRRRERERLAVSPAGEARPDQVLARGEILQRLVAALLALPAPYRDALLQRYFEDRSPGDIATASGVPLATVKTRLRRGLGHLRTLLDGGGDGEGGGAVDWRPTLVAAIGLRPATVAAAPTGVLLMTASTKLTLGAAIAVAALAALLFWSSWSGGTAPPADETSSSVAANVAAQSSRTGPPTGERLAGTGVVERRQISPAPTAVGPMVQVRVSDPGGSPVAFAEVLRSEPNRAPLAATLPAAERRLLQWDSEAWLARFGATVETDADGIARWPWRELPKNGQWQCVARRGELYGELYVSPMALADEVHELRLQPDRSCRVVVVDAQGRSAAAIPIAARYSLQRDAGAGQTSCGWTDSAGLCVVRHVQLWSDRIEPRGSTLPARFCVAWPGIDVGVEVDAARLPEESLTLVLPDSGSVEVHVRTNAGQPVVGRVFGLADAERPSDGLWTARTDAQGVARFASVALGRSWLVGFEHAPPDRYRAVDGPRRAGELARVDWTLDDDAVLVGRLLRDGAPLAGVALQVAASTMPATATPIATDGDGVFQLRFALGPRERRLTEIRLRPADDDRGVHGTCATWRGDLLLAPGEYDLGALVVLPEPIVVEVQFVVPQGTVASDVGFAVEAATGPPEDPWRVVPLPKRREGEDRFAVFGEVPAAA